MPIQGAVAGTVPGYLFRDDYLVNMLKIIGMKRTRKDKDVLYHISQKIQLHSQNQEHVVRRGLHRHLSSWQPHRDDKLKQINKQTSDN